MSEYQYFEFQAVDRPLRKEEMAQLRSYALSPVGYRLAGVIDEELIAGTVYLAH
jgi:hypothetical protein